MTMKLRVIDYATLVFDCDGVILNSNKVKTDAFYKTALPYGKATAERLVGYHITHGGVSRYKKFAYFIEHILPAIAPHIKSPSLEALLKNYANTVRQGLLTCAIAEGLFELRELTPDARWLIVSGGDQDELREVFSLRGLDQLFDGGIFGSPDTKDTILEREIANGNLTKPALFLGDSKYDHQAASKAGLDFVFLSNWTEVPAWDVWCKEKNIVQLQNLKRLQA